MDAKEYLHGAHQKAIVPDLIAASNLPLSVVFLVESPHYDELLSGAPLTGGAGKLALNYIRDQTGSSEGLGPWLSHKIGVGNARAAIMNVSQVPLQEKAFDRARAVPLKPKLTPDEWRSLERVRTKKPSVWTPEEDQLGQILTGELQQRVSRLNTGTGAMVVPCGRFAKTFLESIVLPPGCSMLPVPHPAHSQWQQAKGQVAMNLVTARDILLRSV